MKKYFLLAMLCVASLSGMAQYRQQHGQTPPPPPPAQQTPGHHHGQTPPPPAPPANNGHHHGQTPPPPAPGHHTQTPPPPAPKPVICATPEQIQLALQVIDKQYSDDKRMDIAKLCVTLGHFCTRDLARIASRFTMEDSKVSFLRYAYRYCEDQDNYYTLRDVLRYRSDYEKVMEVCQPHHRRPW